MRSRAHAAWATWLLAALFYFYQYALRTAPGVMMPQLSGAFGVSTIAIASLAGVFYFGYSPFSLVAGSALDRIGAKIVLPAGAVLTGLGALLFGAGSWHMANVGRFLQGAGGVFSFVGAVYIAGKYFPASRAATLIGITQAFGMAGGAAGQFLVGPLIAKGVDWKSFWISAGLAGLVIALVLFFTTPKEDFANTVQGGARSVTSSLGIIFANPQSILCGLIAALLFIPTTILDMIWGVSFLQQGRGFDYGEAVIRSATVPVGWIVGCPLMGLISDRIGRRKPVIVSGSLILLACIAWVLYGEPNAMPPYVVGLMAGIASGVAMLPYTVIKEANPRELAGTATGVISFQVFTISALLGPVLGWILQHYSGGKEAALEHYQTTFQLLLWGIALAIVLTFVLKETGAAAHARSELERAKLV
jgi:MFS family permease